jgi:hypothetical protein
VLAIVGEKGEVVLDGSCANEEISVINGHTGLSQSATFTSKDFCGLFIKAHDGNALEKVIERLLARFRVPRIVDTFIEFSERYHRKTKTFVLKVL